MLNSKNRAYLRGLANTLSPLFQVGKGGVGEEMCRQISNCLETHELMKLTVLETCDLSPKDAASAIAEATGAEVVCVTGKKAVLFRPAAEADKRKIFLPC